MAHLAHTAGELLAEAAISFSNEVLVDLEQAMADELSAVVRVLRRIEKRLAVELAGRTPSVGGSTTSAHTTAE